MNSDKAAPKHDVEVLIVGAGPAGLQLANQLQEAGLSYEVIERDEVASTFEVLPRHRQLISINKVNTGGLQGDEKLRYDWNSLLSDHKKKFTDYSEDYFPEADDYVRYLRDFAAEADLNITTGTAVERVQRAGHGYTLHLSDGSTRTVPRVVFATGLARSNTPDILGYEHAEQYATFETDPKAYRDQRVLIIGKGNSAFETAESLIPFASTIHLCSPSPVKLAWQTHYVGHLRAINNNFLDTYELKSQNAALDAHVTRLEKRDDGIYAHLAYSHADGHETVIRYDRVIGCAGFRFDQSIFDEDCCPETVHDGRFPALSSSYEVLGQDGMFFAGVLMHGRDYRKYNSGFIHGFRYNVDFLGRLLSQRIESEVAGAPRLSNDELHAWILTRLNSASSNFLQPGLFGDIAYLDGSNWGFVQDVSMEWAADNPVGDKWMSIGLEFGPPASDPFMIERSQTLEYAEITPFLHPVIRFYEGFEVVKTLHLVEDVENVFEGDLIAPPLHEFIALCSQQVRAVSVT